jgi:endoribonuclease LACTB2
MERGVDACLGQAMAAVMALANHLALGVVWYRQGAALGATVGQGSNVCSSPPVTIVNVGYRSTNYWVVSAGRTRVLFDLGWPGMFGAMRANLKRMDIPLSEIRYGIASHYHVDHAGCAQDLKQCGVRLIVTTEQVEWIPAMQRWIKPTDNYTPIATDDNLLLATAESRELLATMGIAGEIVHTPGHSPDSVSLVLDSGIAFIGDLPPTSRLALEDPLVLAESWQRLRERGVTTVYGAHMPPLPIEAM